MSWPGFPPDLELLAPHWLWGIPCGALLVVLSLRFGRRSIAASALRVFTLALIFIALADPVTRETSTSEELAALVDVSSSVSDAGLRAFAESLVPYAHEGAQLKAYPFGRDLARAPVVVEPGASPARVAAALREAGSSIDRGETNIEHAISGVTSRSASSALLVLSDGYQTEGDAKEAASRAAQQGVRLFPVIPDDTAFRAARFALSSLSAPVTAHSNENVEARVSVINTTTSPRRGMLELWLGTEKLYSQTVDVTPGEERLSIVKVPTAKGGLQRLRAVLRPDGAAEAEERYRWIAIKEKAKMLLLSGSHEDERLLKQIVTYKGFGLEDIVTDGSKPIPQSLESFSSVVLNNVANRQLPAGFLATLKAFVSAGGGLLIVGGDRSYGLGGYIDTPLEEVSPLKFVPPQTEKRRLNNAVALVIDKSGSMKEDNKILGAKMAAMSSVQLLKDDDYFGIVGFDAGPSLVLDVMPVPEARQKAENQLRYLTPYGKTNLLPALALARQRLEQAKASRRHIIVLSDGKIPLTEEEYLAEINNLARSGITVSAVAVGLDADVPFMKILSKYGHGAFYQTLDANQLPRIFLDDIKVATGEKTLKEGQELAVGPGPAGLISTHVEGEPSLRGFVETLPKKNSQLELIVRGDEKVSPLLASWNYEKGRVVAFTSDANGRWSLPWVSWRGFAPFWGDMLDGIKDRSNKDRGEVDFDMRYRVDHGRVVFDLAVYDQALSSRTAPRIVASVKEPGGEMRRVSFQQVKPGRFEGTLEHGRPGDYLLDVEYGELKLPSLGVTLDGSAFGERQGQGIQVSLLEQLARTSGGRLNPDRSQLSGLKRVSTSKTSLAWIPALMAFGLLLLEAFIREVGLFSLLSAVRIRRGAAGSDKNVQGEYQPKSISHRRSARA